MLTLNTLRWGSDAPQRERRALRAGPLTMLFEDGGLRAIRLGEREVLRRIYVAVRDRTWGTVPLALSDLRIEEGPDHFALSFQAAHREGAIDFRWRGTITGDERGTVTFGMDGAAHSTFLRSRIGFCILHPPEGCAGRSCVVEHDDGGRATDEFPYFIAPHQPFKEMRAIAHQAAPGVWAEVRFAGDIFEMEDQRNWTDASYKTYCTPLRLPYPVEVAAGTAVAQSVTLSLTGATARADGGSQGASPAIVTVGDEAIGTLPRLGFGLAADQPMPDAAQLALLRALRPAHLRVDLRPWAAGWRERLARATDEARALGAALEVAVILSEDGEAELAALAGAATELATPVDRWLVFHRDEKVTGARWTALARRILGPVAPGAAIGGGTDAYFTELNRERPAPGSADLVAYSINPQVHAFDDLSIVETLTMQGATVESARQFLGDTPLAITPITLLPRHNPDGSVPPGAGDPAPPPADPRQGSLFAAAWTVGSLAALAASGVASATYYETTGPRGLLAADGVYPVYHVFAALADLPGGAVLPAATSDPLRAAALAIRREGRTRILLANLLAERQAITLRAPGARATIRRLDETSAETALRSPAEFRATVGEAVEFADGAVEVELGAYGVAEIEVG